MKYKVGNKVRVVKPYSGGNFNDGDIVTIECIGFEDDYDCYGATSPDDGLMWYLNEDEVESVTNGDRIRDMSDDELAETLNSAICPPDTSCNIGQQCVKCWVEWLRKPVEVK